MRTQRIGLSLALSIGAVICQGAASAEEYRGSYEQQMACTPDVWRLCSDHIPDVNGIVACLRDNTPRLSSGCRAVFESSAAVPQPQAPSGTTGRARPYGAPQQQQPYVAQPQPQPQQRYYYYQD